MSDCQDCLISCAFCVTPLLTASKTSARFLLEASVIVITNKGILSIIFLSCESKSLYEVFSDNDKS